MTRRLVGALAVTLAAVGGAPAAQGQGWAADVSAGRLVYDPVSSNIATSNIMGSLRYDSRRDTWVYGAGAVPAGERSTWWGAAGAGGRVVLAAPGAGRARLGADLGAHAFTFRDRVVDQAGSGGTLEAVPFARLALGAGFVEGRAGWRGQTLSFADAREDRDVFETGARAGYGADVRIEGDLRWVHAAEGTYPFAGATVAYAGPRVDVWAQAGKWLANDLDDRVWAVGSGVSLGVRTSVWGSVRQEAPDPLYWNAVRRTWSVGLTQRLGRLAAPPPIARPAAGAVVIRLEAADAPPGAVWIAGDFNNWQPAPMARDGDAWVATLPLGAGVYRYSFRSASGEWFVPESTPGRRDDGMGGYVAVLVVS